MIEYKNKNVLICGTGISGRSAENLLTKFGANVTIKDIYERPEESFDIIVQSPGVPFELVDGMAPLVIGEFELGVSNYEGPFLAITGTNGKTTTTMLLHHILSASFEVNVAGNIGLPLTSIENKRIPCVVEASSFQLEAIRTFKPCIAAVLNISEDHLDRHKTMENYIKAKERIFENQTEEDILVLNFKDEVCKLMAKKTKSKVIFFNKGEEPLFDIDKFSLLGKHNYENALAAVQMAKSFGVDDFVIRDRINSFSPPEHRLEYVSTIQNIKIYNDSKATNPNSTVHALSSLNGSVVLIVGGIKKEANYKSLIRHFENVKTIIVYGKDKDFLAEEFSEINVNVLKEDFENVVKVAFKENTQNILFSPACSSFDLFKNFEHRGREFKKLVNELEVIINGCRET